MSDPNLPPNETVAVSPKARLKPGERRLQILQSVAEMLEDPKGERVTTAALAARLSVSEAALYRHFASKAQMFEGLIEFIESSLFSLINQIQTAPSSGGLEQVKGIVDLLLKFSERNPGMTRVLIGDALVTENDRLQERINQLIDRIEASIKQSYRNAASQGELSAEVDISACAASTMALVLGRWIRFAKTGFKKAPYDPLVAHLAVVRQ